jgi:hypothetical protein
VKVRRTRADGREFNHRQGVDLPDAFAFGFHQDLFQQNFILHTVSKIAFTPLTLSQHLVSCSPVNAPPLITPTSRSCLPIQSGQSGSVS